MVCDAAIGQKRGIQITQNYSSTFLDARVKSDVIATGAGTQWLNSVTVKPLAL